MLILLVKWLISFVLPGAVDNYFIPSSVHKFSKDWGSYRNQYCQPYVDYAEHVCEDVIQIREALHFHTTHLTKNNHEEEVREGHQTYQ